MCRAAAQTRWSEVSPGRELAPAGIEPLAAHNFQRQRGAVEEGLLDFGEDGERDGGGCLRAEVEACWCVDELKPAAERGLGSAVAEKARSLSEHLACAALRAEDSDISERLVAREQRSEKARILIEAVGHNDGGVARAQIEMRKRWAGHGGDVEHCGNTGERETIAVGEMRAAIGNGGEPSKLARLAGQRLCVVAGAEDPEARACRAVAGPDFDRAVVDGNFIFRRCAARESARGEEVESLPR